MHVCRMANLVQAASACRGMEASKYIHAYQVPALHQEAEEKPKLSYLQLLQTQLVGGRRCCRANGVPASSGCTRQASCAPPCCAQCTRGYFFVRSMYCLCKLAHTFFLRSQDSM